jgi:hypothetical protein
MDLKNSSWPKVKALIASADTTVQAIAYLEEGINEYVERDDLYILGVSHSISTDKYGAVVATAIVTYCSIGSGATSRWQPRQ